MKIMKEEQKRRKEAGRREEKKMREKESRKIKERKFVRRDKLQGRDIIWLFRLIQDFNSGWNHYAYACKQNFRVQ